MEYIKKNIHTIITQIIFWCLVIGLWEFVANAELFGPSSKLIFPTLEEIGKAFMRNFSDGFAGTPITVYIFNSMRLLLQGLFYGVLFAIVFSGLAIISKTIFVVYNTIVSVFDLLPGVALLPVVIMLFGIKEDVIIFLVIHAVIWPMSRNMLDGFNSVPRMYIEAGRNIGLRGPSLLFGIYIPASMTFLISGVKAGWARAWRGLISAEMIFSIASCQGIGLYINQMRMSMKNAEMYATLLVIIIIGVVVQYGVIYPIEKYTVKRWGMSR